MQLISFLVLSCSANTIERTILELGVVFSSSRSSRLIHFLVRSGVTAAQLIHVSLPPESKRLRLIPQGRFTWLGTFMDVALNTGLAVLSCECVVVALMNYAQWL